MTLLNDISVGMNFILNGELYEKITPIKKNCCSSFTAKKISDNTNVVINPTTEITLPICEE